MASLKVYSLLNEIFLTKDYNLSVWDLMEGPVDVSVRQSD